jgi:lipoprotein-anchoring transpeptidase ErfK/SrfK
MKFSKSLFALALVVLTLIAMPAAKAGGEVVPFQYGYRPGTIVVVTSARQLFYVLNDRQAIRYPVGVGRAGMAWHGSARVARKDIRPAWVREPGKTRTIPGGSSDNPMGAAAMGLDHGNYAIHGTNDPRSIGHFVSHGCIRMYNADIMDLYQRTAVGTEVYVLR